MSRIRSLVRLALPAGVALTALAAPQGASALASLQYTCSANVTGSGTFTIDVEAFTPQVTDPFDFLRPSDVVVAAMQSSLRRGALRQTHPGAETVTGTAELDLSMSAEGSPASSFIVPLAVETTSLSDPTMLYATGKTPQGIEPPSGFVRFAAGDIRFNLKALDANGAPIPWREVDDLPPRLDSDGDRNTFDITCKRSDATQVADVSYTNVSNIVYEACFFGGDFCPAPTPPRHVHVGNVGSDAADLVWTGASRHGFGDYGGFIYEITIDGKTVTSTGGRTTLTGLQPNTSYSGTIRTKYSQDPTPTPSTTVPFSFKTGQGPVVEPELGPPTEAEQFPSDITSNSVIVRWGHPTSNPGGAGLTSYVLHVDGEEYTVPATTTFKRFDGLLPDSDFRVDISAIDDEGRRSEALTLFYVTNHGPICNCAPRPVRNLRLTGSTPTQLSIAWDAPDGDLQIAKYQVLLSGNLVVTVTGTQAVLTGLTANTSYSIQVVPVDKNGLAGPSATVTAKTLQIPPIEPETRTYSTVGSLGLKTLTRGTLPLKGSAQLEFAPSASARRVKGSLEFAQTSGRLISLGFLPVTAKIQLASSGSAVGTLGGFTGGLTLNQQVRVKVTEARLFGAIPLVGGNNCQTKQLVDLALDSGAGGFTIAAGGTVSGTFKIGDLNGCGALNGLVSPATAGGGNTISLTLSPKA